MIQLLPLNAHYVDWFSDLLPADLVTKITTDATYIGFGAIVDDTACGVLCCAVTDELVELLYLYVAPGFRRRGIATEMMVSMAKRTGAVGMPMVGYFSASSESDTLYRFFNELNGFSMAATSQGDALYTVPLSDIASIAQKPQLFAGQSVPFHTLSQEQRQAFYAKAAQAGYPFIADYEAYRQSYVPELCQCLVGEDGVTSAIFYEQMGVQDLKLSFLFSQPGHSKEVSNLVAASAQWILQSPYRNGMLEVVPMDDGALRLFHHLFPQAQASAQVYVLGQDLNDWEVN